LTLRTISDVLWATDHEPKDFEADPIEELSQNCPSFAALDREYKSLWTTTHSYTVHHVGIPTEEWGQDKVVYARVQVGVSG
jgi:hypothetical protein